jgi:transposase
MNRSCVIWLKIEVTRKSWRNKKLRDEIKRLQKDLRKKEKALAEMAALYTLKKKADELWGEHEEE